ncbi:cystathionine beta-lyase [Afifella sp. YEN Y35]|uniref:cystathionine beta-lyase n=1 Tax=Afifella sp. YEN Y35 TaxID=3388337 RepID=UPI0039DF930B
MPDSGSSGSQPRPETLLSRLGRPLAHPGPVNMPLHRASTIVFDTLEDLEAAKSARFDKGTLFYGRFGTPDVFAFEEAIATLSEGYGTVAVPSGLAACVLPLVAFLKPGDHVLVTDSVYEPARTSLSAFIARSGVEVSYFDPRAGENIADAMRPNTRLVYLESPGSLTFEVQDLPAIAAVARAHGALTMCDNTWASPLFMKPLALGVDLVVEAATKYVVGHSDAMIGTVTAACEEHHRLLRQAANWLGYRISPDDVYLAARGLRTLGVRLERHYRTGLALAEWLESQPQVRRVLHPALASHPDHALWRRDFSGASGLFAIELDATKAGATAFVEALQLFSQGFSWGGFESLVLLTDPGHARTATRWEAEGSLVRLYAGLEDADDLKADLKSGLDRLYAFTRG